MSSGLTSSSTLAQVLACYDDNASYFENQNTQQALAFVTACLILLRRLPTMAKSAAGSEVQVTPEIVQEQLNLAKDFLAANGIYPGSQIPLAVETSFQFLR